MASTCIGAADSAWAALRTGRALGPRTSAQGRRAARCGGTPLSPTPSRSLAPRLIRTEPLRRFTPQRAPGAGRRGGGGTRAPSMPLPRTPQPPLGLRGALGDGGGRGEGGSTGTHALTWANRCRCFPSLLLACARMRRNSAREGIIARDVSSHTKLLVGFFSV